MMPAAVPYKPTVTSPTHDRKIDAVFLDVPSLAPPASRCSRHHAIDVPLDNKPAGTTGTSGIGTGVGSAEKVQLIGKPQLPCMRIPDEFSKIARSCSSGIPLVAPLLCLSQS